MYTISKSFTFSAAHYLVGYHGMCQNLHGHNWRVTVKISGAYLDPLGILMDFKDLKRIMEERVGNRFDHKYLNQCVDFNPTAENIAEWIFGQISDEISKNRDYINRGIKVESVVVNEGEDSCCEFVL